MKNENYFLCSHSVTEHFPDFEYSKAFMSGYDHDTGNEYHVGLLNFDEVDKYFKEVIEPFNEKSRVAIIDFWCRECVPGTMDISKITLTGAKHDGLFVEIERKTGLTSSRNRAMTIHELSEKFNCTPIELINKITV